MKAPCPKGDSAFWRRFAAGNELVNTLRNQLLEETTARRFVSGLLGVWGVIHQNTEKIHEDADEVLCH